MKALVIPTIREDSIKRFLEEWDATRIWDVVIVVEDNPEKSFCIDTDCHVSWKEIDEDLGDDAWIISRRDSAIRSYGFLLAHRLGADYIFTLDDDCYPLYEGEDFVKQHLEAFQGTPKWTELIPGLRTRGLPYENKGVLEDVVLNVGLWTNIPDLDAIQMFLRENEVGGFWPKAESRVIPAGQYFPLCGMNFAFHRSITPLAYFALMGNESPYRRFDDIWFGVIAKRVCDHLGLRMTCGTPFVHHDKASNRFDNLIKEAPGIKANETFWKHVEDVDLTRDTPKGCVEQIGLELIENEDRYISRLGQALLVWSKLF